MTVDPTATGQIKDVAPQVTQVSLNHDPEKAIHQSQCPVADTSTDAASDAASDAPKLQRWNHPRGNIYRVLATYWCFMILGANDAAYGALIPYLEVYYDVDYITISLIFLSPIVGYVLSALTNNLVHVKFGQRGIAMCMGLLHVLAYLVISFHPPYPALVVIFAVAGLANGLGDSAWNAWQGAMENSNEILGFLHAFYGLGALLSPLIATALITKAGWQWYEFYYLMVGASAIEFVTLTASFWNCTAAVYHQQHRAAIEAAKRLSNQDAYGSPGTMTPTTDEQEHRTSFVQRLNPFSETFFMNPPAVSKRKASPPSKLSLALQRFLPLEKTSSTTYRAITNRVTILTATFLLLYVGAEVSQGGWLITFLIRVRHGSAFASGMAGMGFWLGLTVGRLVLGFVTARCFATEKHALAFYLVLSLIVQVLFWSIPVFVVSSVMAALLGFLIAPFFPIVIVILTRTLPSDLHVAAVGFSAAVGASGATVLPFATGAIAQSKGVGVLQPIILALLIAVLIIALLMPSLPSKKKTGQRNARE